MARLRDLQRKVDGDAKIKAMASLTVMLEVLDAFRLTKKDDNITLNAYIHMYSKEFTADDLFSLAQPLGDWLCFLPAEIWDEKKLKK